MTASGSGTDINQRLKHRDVLFSIKRVSEDDPRLPYYRWTIYPASGAPNRAAEGLVDGRGSFGRAYAAAQAAIDQWLDDLIARGLSTPEFLITDGGSGLDRALAALWPNVPAQRCTVHKHRNLLAHAPDALHEEVTADYNDMIYAETAKELQTKRRAFLRKWPLRCPAVATSLEEADERLFAFLRLLSTITLFDGLVVADFDGLPASASR